MNNLKIQELAREIRRMAMFISDQIQSPIVNKGQLVYVHYRLGEIADRVEEMKSGLEAV